MKYTKEYADYIKKLTDKFSEMCSVKFDYEDYCNNILKNDDFMIKRTFQPLREDTLINMMLDDNIEMKGNIVRIKNAIKWFNENFITFDEWNKTN